jgi:hypothetical protein
MQICHLPTLHSSNLLLLLLFQHPSTLVDAPLRFDFPKPKVRSSKESFRCHFEAKKSKTSFIYP